MEFRNILLIVIIGIVYSNNGKNTQECVTNNPQDISVPCNFPFIFQKKIYFGCSTDFNPNITSLLCSTNTTSNFEHITGKVVKKVYPLIIKIEVTYFFQK